MEQQPTNNENWEQPQLPFDDIKPDTLLENDTIISYGLRLQDFIDASSPEWKYENVDHSIKNINKNFGENYDRFAVASAAHVFMFVYDSNGKATKCLHAENASVCGVIKRTRHIELEKPFIIFELEEASVFYTDREGAQNSFESTAPVLIPISFISSFELM